jgi:hypothetical protein
VIPPTWQRRRRICRRRLRSWSGRLFCQRRGATERPLSTREPPR